jgi:hypothetical protein
MRLRTSVILVALTLFAVATTASATMPWQPKQPKPKADAISGVWDAVLIADHNTRQLTLTLKLEGNKVTGSFESSHLGSGAVNNGSWANNKLTISMETRHAPLTLNGDLQNGKLAGEWDAGHMQGKWEAKKKLNRPGIPGDGFR